MKKSYVIIFMGLLFSVASIIISHFLYKNVLANEKEKLSLKISTILNDKNSICDGIIYRTNGVLNKLVKPISENYSNNYEYRVALNNYEQQKKIGYKAIFELSKGGISLVKFQKFKNGYKLTKHLSKNLIFLSYDNIYIKGKTNLFYIDNCYKETFNQLISVDFLSCYSSGNYSKIISIPELCNKYYKLENISLPTYPKKSTSKGSIYSQSNFYIMEFEIISSYYEIMENKETTKNLRNNYYLKGAFIAIFIFIFSFLLSKYLKSNSD